MDLELFIPLGAISALNVSLIGVLYVLSRSLRSVVDTNIALNNEIQEAVRDRRDREAERVILQEQVVQLATENKQLILDLEGVRHELNAVRLAHETAIVIIKAEIETAKEELVKSGQNIATLNASVTKLETREMRLSITLEQAEARIKQLETENIGLLKRVDELESALAIAKTERAKAQKENEALLSVIEQLKKRPPPDDDPPPKAPVGKPIPTDQEDDDGEALDLAA